MELKNIRAYQLMPTIHSIDVEWKNWYKLISRKYGRPFAATLFLKVWEKQGTQQANTVDLRNELSKYGIHINETIFNQIADVGSDVTDSIQNALHVGKIAVYSLGGIVILGFGLLIYNIAKDPGRAVGTALKYAK